MKRLLPRFVLCASVWIRSAVGTHVGLDIDVIDTAGIGKEVERRKDADDDAKAGTKGQSAAFAYKAQTNGVHEKQRYPDKDVVQGFRCVHCRMTAAKKEYIISEGALLGAARNGFLLPWDADGDIVFDARGLDGKDDLASFYRLFTPGMAPENDGCKESCGEMTLHLFIGDTKIGGRKMHYYQGYDEIMMGSLTELHEDKQQTAPTELHAELKERVKGMLVSRLHFDNKHNTRFGGRGYIDVVPYYLNNKSAGALIELREDPVTSVDISSMFPIKTCNVANFGKTGVEMLELKCPAHPQAYLEKTYGPSWKAEPYNTYLKTHGDEGEWIKEPRGGTLEAFLKGSHNYSGTLSLAETGTAGCIGLPNHMRNIEKFF